MLIVKCDEVKILIQMKWLLYHGFCSAPQWIFLMDTEIHTSNFIYQLYSTVFQASMGTLLLLPKLESI